MTRRVYLSSLVASACVLIGPSHVYAQSIRITGVSTFQYLDVRTLADDSIPLAVAIGDGLLRRSPDGFVVRCVTGDQFCRYRRINPAESTVPAIQDLNINVWGLGRGVRLYGRLRGRGMVVGDESLWPRADDRLDVQAAYVEINRSSWRGRAGRIWKTSGLGYHNFDGASLVVQPVRFFSFEAYGGWSLVRGINETLTSGDLAAVEPLAPDESAYLLGSQLSFRPRAGSALSVHYQREIRTDRAGLYSERVALDGVVRAGLTTVDAAFKYDLATNQVNESRIRVWLPPFASLSVNGYARQYKPFFELWTIWGAFSPLGYSEIGVNTTWHAPQSPHTIDVWAGARRYEGTDADTLFTNFRPDGWRVGASVASQLSPQWHVLGLYRADIGFGAARSDGSVRLQRSIGNGNLIGVHAAAFQRLYEFRVDESTTYGLGADVHIHGGSRTRVIGNVTAYRHTSPATQAFPDWTQLRGSVRFEWTIGVEPTVTRRPVRLR